MLERVQSLIGLLVDDDNVLVVTLLVYRAHHLHLLLGVGVGVELAVTGHEGDVQFLVVELVETLLAILLFRLEDDRLLDVQESLELKHLIEILPVLQGYCCLDAEWADPLLNLFVVL